VADVRKILGDCMGVKLSARRDGDPHLCFTIMVENDGEWFERMGASSAWLDELIDVLQQARDYCAKHHAPDIAKRAPGFPPNTQFGWKIKKRSNPRRKKP